MSDYHRDKDRTHLTINTDENTVEKVRLNHDGAPDAAASYLLWGEPFSGRDWLLIEQAPGVLIDGMRATVWVCESDGIAPIVDWQPAPD